MTFPGVSVIEWMVDCGRDSVRCPEVGRELINYFIIGPKVDNPGHVLEVLPSSLLRHPERSGVNDMAIVIVQVFRDMIYIPVYESLTPIVHKFDLRGFGTFLAGHLGEKMEGG